MITFAGIPPLLETPAARRWLDRYQPAPAWRDFDSTFWSGPDPWLLPLSPKPEPPPVRLGVLWWPTGASRFACCHLLFDHQRLAALHDELGPANDPADLRLWDKTAGGEVTARMRVVAERRILDFGEEVDAGAAGSGSGGGDTLSRHGLSVVTLADARWDWRLKPLSVADTPGSWEELIGAVAAALGVEIEVDAIDPAFGTPSDRWVGYARPATAVLDAAVNAVGQRLVRRLDGTVLTQNWDTALTARGISRRKTSGGVVGAATAGRLAPAAVRVAFAREAGGAPFTVDRTLAELAIPEFGDAVGSAGQTATVNCDGVVHDGNDGECEDAATAAATAWYGWRLGPADVVLPGVYAHTLTGQDDAVEWDHSLDPAAADATDLYPVRTRVTSGAANWFPSGGGTPAAQDDGGGGDSSAPCSGPGLLAGATKHDCWVLSVTDANGNMEGVNTEQRILLTWDAESGSWLSQTNICTCLSQGRVRLTRGHEGDPKLEIVGLGVDGPCPGGIDCGEESTEGPSGYAGDYQFTFHCARGKSLYFKAGNTGDKVLCCSPQKYSEENTFTVSVTKIPGCIGAPPTGCVGDSYCFKSTTTDCVLPGRITMTVVGAMFDGCPDGGDMSWANGQSIDLYFKDRSAGFGPQYAGAEFVDGGAISGRLYCGDRLGEPTIWFNFFLQTDPASIPYFPDGTGLDYGSAGGWSNDGLAFWTGSINDFCETLSAGGVVFSDLTTLGPAFPNTCAGTNASITISFSVPSDEGGSGSGPLPDGCGSGGECLACQDGAGDALEGHPQLELVIPDGDVAGTYTFSWDEGVGWYVQDGGGAGYVKCLTDSGDPSIGVWTVQLEVADGMEVDLYGPANAVTTSECGSAFGLTLDGPTFGSAETPTVGVA